jgi:plastocyanin
LTSLASIAADMPKRALLILAALGLAATACISSTTPPVDYGQGQRFVPFVVDSQDDVGQGDAVALTANGEPYLSYFGFPAKLAQGEIAVPRPFGAPAVPGVLLATASSDGLWQRGAVNTIKPDLTASGVSVPFGPVETPNLDLKPENANGTSLVLADDGTVHVAWVMGGGVYYGTTKLGGTSTVDQVFDLGSSVSQAGPIGAPGIALDGNGDPWIAFTAETASGRAVHVVHPDGTTWADEVVDSFGSCNGCGNPQPTGIGVVGNAPMVVYVDGPDGMVRSATQSGKAWTSTTVAASAGGSGAQTVGQGLAFATDGKAAFASYIGGDGTVQVASWASGSWTTTKVADAATPSGASSGVAAQTAVTLDDSGTVYVAWIDQGLHLSSGTDSFTSVDLGHTVQSAATPSLSANGSTVALSWYDPDQQNLMVGFYGDLQGLVVAQPSPSLTLSSQAPSGGAECGSDKKVQLDIIAKGVAFDPTCLVAAPGSFTINFDNQDAGIQHNIAVLDQKGGTQIAATDIAAGPVKQTLDLKLDPGTYYFQCDVHPTTMFGTLAVVAGAK